MSQAHQTSSPALIDLLDVQPIHTLNQISPVTSGKDFHTPNHQLSDLHNKDVFMVPKEELVVKNC